MTPTLIAAGVLASLCASEAETVESAAQRFESHYVLDEKAADIAGRIRSEVAQASVAEQCRAPEEFADALTDALREISSDKHVSVEPPRSEAGEGSEEAGGDWIARWYGEAPEVNYGVAEVRLLEGNVGYLKLTSFYDLQETWARYGAAFTLLQDTRALILDLRGNGGGSPDAEIRMQWSFLDDGATAPLVIDRGAAGYEARPEPQIDWPRYGEARPLYILTNGRTFSAAEAVAYGLQSAGRATVVGEATGGGAHMVGGALPLAGGYQIGMPQTRPVSPHTDANWEGTGVIPDYDVEADGALEAALSLIAPPE